MAINGKYMADWDETQLWASYDEFAVSGVPMLVPQPSIGDSKALQNGQYFSTKDQDNDDWNGVNCSLRDQGAWWLNGCIIFHLIGEYYNLGQVENTWQTWKCQYYSQIFG